MGDENVGQSQLLLKVHEQINNLRLNRHVQSGYGFIANDEFRIYGNNISKVVMKVFNQWGQMIFEGNNQLRGWNGSFKGQAAPIGVYVYVVQITMKDNSVVNRKGSINLVR